MAAKQSPTIRRIRLGAELRRLRMACGLTGVQVADQLLISQPKISLMETGRRAASPRDVRDLCRLYGVVDDQVVDGLMRMAGESGRRGWWVAYGEVPYAVYIGLETEASSIRSYEPLLIPGLFQTPAYAAAVVSETIPRPTSEQASARLEVRMRRQYRAHHPARRLRLWVVLDESVLHRVVGGSDTMREQLEHLNHLGAQSHITVQVLPYDAGAHPGVSGQFSLLCFTGEPGAGTVYLERLTSDLYLEKRADVQRYGVMYDHLQAQALSPEDSAHLITHTIKVHAGSSDTNSPA